VDAHPDGYHADWYLSRLLGGLTENAWAVHVHYWTATLWYIFLISQPYLASRGQFERHRTSGMIGFFLAGGVAFTALGALHRDIANAENSAQMREQFGRV
jgi:hypothetical protein